MEDHRISLRIWSLEHWPPRGSALAFAPEPHPPSHVVHHQEELHQVTEEVVRPAWCLAAVPTKAGHHQFLRLEALSSPPVAACPPSLLRALHQRRSSRAGFRALGPLAGVCSAMSWSKRSSAVICRSFEAARRLLSIDMASYDRLGS